MEFEINALCENCDGELIYDGEGYETLHDIEGFRHVCQLCAREYYFQYTFPAKMTDPDTELHAIVIAHGCAIWIRRVEDLSQTVEVTRHKLDTIAHAVIDIILEKNHDYGDAWQRDAIPGVMSRLKDKLCRIERLSDGRVALVAGENLPDTLVDAIGYSMLGLLYLQETEGLDLRELG